MRLTRLKENVCVVTEKNEWDDILGQISNFDFYHTYDYHNISRQENEKPILIAYQNDDRVIAIPLMLRNIDDTGYNDATSAYGYCGPIHNNSLSDFDNQKFKRSVRGYLREMRVVTAFSRLNPYIKNQDLILNGLGEIGSLSKVVYIDLNQDLATQKKFYNPRLKTYINKCRKEYIVKEAENEHEIKNFVSIYYENMLRVNAKDKYFFPGSYFLNLWKSKDFKTKFLLAYDKANEELAGGAIFTMVNDIVQYHLSGARKEYLKLNPIKVLIDDMRIEATNKGFKYFNLGGGVGNHRDNLFRFKSGFSKDFKTFKVWKYIVDQKIHDELVAIRHHQCGYDKNTCQRFFPCYRCNLHT